MLLPKEDFDMTMMRKYVSVSTTSVDRVRQEVLGTMRLAMNGEACTNARIDLTISKSNVQGQTVNSHRVYVHSQQAGEDSHTFRGSRPNTAPCPTSL